MQDDGDVVVYGLADESEPVGRGFEPYEEAAVGLRPEWVDLRGDALPVDRLQSEAQQPGEYPVTVAESYEVLDDDLMPLAVRYREHDTPEGSPGTVLTYQGSGIDTVDDLQDITVAVEDVQKGTTMAFLAAAEAAGYDANKFDLVEVPEDESPEMLESQELDAAILDSDDWMTGGHEEVFNFNRALKDEYGEVPPAQVWVADRDSYRENTEAYEDFVQWGDNVRRQVEERTANSSDLTPEQARKIDMHERFGEFRPQDMKAIQDIAQVARKTD